MFIPKSVFKYAGENYIGIEDAAELFGVSTRTIYRWVNDRGLPAYTNKRRLIFKPAECVEWWETSVLKPARKDSKSEKPQQGEAS